MDDIFKFKELLIQEKITDVLLYDNNEWFRCIVGTATSARHIKSLVKKFKFNKLITKENIFSDLSNEWVIISVSDFEIHLFIHSKRSYYNLDQLWSSYGI